MKKILLMLVAVALFACGEKKEKISVEKINNQIAAGNFTRATAMIDSFVTENKLSEKEIYDLRFQQDLMARKRIDFNKTLDDVLPYIKKYYPDVNDEMLANWEKTNALECMTIDNKKMYFSNAARNLFRIDKAARDLKNKIDNAGDDDLQGFLEKHLAEVIAQAKKSPTHQSEPKKFKITYTLTVKPDVVPAGKTLRCWLPYPRTDSRRQSEIKLLSTNFDKYEIAPDTYKHKSIYVEKTTEAGQPTVFTYTFTMNTCGEWFNLKPEDIKPYDKNSEIYKKYTAERATHVIFTDAIKAKSKEIVGDETNPLLVSNKILQYIKDNYPWASALEYSTMANIPEYVICNNRGDCGMVGLFYITLCRLNGIPARWQSGHMLHPKEEGMHDWAETYFEGVGWVPVDPSFIRRTFADKDMNAFYSNGIDAYRWIINDDFSEEFYPAKKYPRSETVDFQRGEVEYDGGNLYFDKWKWNLEVEYLN